MQRIGTSNVIASAGKRYAPCILLMSLVCCLSIGGCDSLTGPRSSRDFLNTVLTDNLPGSNPTPSGPTTVAGVLTQRTDTDTYIFTVRTAGDASITVASSAFSPSARVLSSPNNGGTSPSSGGMVGGNGTMGANYTATFSQNLGEVTPFGAVSGTPIPFVSSSSADDHSITITFQVDQPQRYAVIIGSTSSISRSACPVTGSAGGAGVASSAGPPVNCIPDKPTPGSVTFTGTLNSSSQSVLDATSNQPAFYQAYSFTPTSNAQAMIRLDAGFDAQISAFSITTAGAIKVSNSPFANTNGGTVTATFNVTAGAQYIVLVTTAFLNETGTYMVSFSPELGTVQPVLLQSMGTAQPGGR